MWLGLALLSALCYLGLALGGRLDGPGVAHYLVFYSFAFLLYLASIALLSRRLPSLALIWTAAVICRLTLFLSPPSLSNDVNRYIWDGHVAVNGVNPYAFAVDSPSLDYLATPLRGQINNDWMASPYLPAAQLLFAAVERLAPQSQTAFRIVMTGFDLTAGALLTHLLQRLGKPPALALAYLWNPLVVVEFAHGAHLDAMMIALTLGALTMVIAGRRTSSAILLSLATLTKGIPALLLFSIWPRWRARDWLIYAGVVVGLSMPYALGAGLGLFGPRAGTGLFGAIREYGYQWNFNGGIYHWLEGWTTGIKTPGALPPETPGTLQAKLIAAGALGLALLWTAWRARKTDDELTLLRLCFVPFAAYLFLTTTVHPWYVTLLVPWAVFEIASKAQAPTWRFGFWDLGFGLSLVYWSWSVGLSYLTYIDRANLRETDPVRGWEYFPLCLLLVFTLVASRLSRSLNSERERGRG